MSLEKQKEYVSLAYLRALASKADALMITDNEDSDSRDAHIKKQIDPSSANSRWGQIAFQLKSTSSENLCREDESYIYYNLKAKNYNDLRKRSGEPLYLALLILPKEENDWININLDRMVIKKCMYWVSLLNEPEKDNTSTIQIKIPKSQQLTEESLIKLLECSPNYVKAI